MMYEDARLIALRKYRALNPYLDRFEIGGSIRRKRREVKDIEFVVMPKMETVEVEDTTSLFPAKSMVTRRVLGFEATVRGFGPILLGKEVKKYVKVELPEGIVLDIFTAHPNNWGLIYMIRTGSANFSHAVLKRGNTLGYTSIDAMWHHGGKPVPMRTEEDVFAAMRMRMPDPTDRELEKNGSLKRFVIY